ncbi:DNA primase [Lactobacillus sp. S2-2]|uniref:DNA primase n=1 Tax=Lactobacillus sp. S2-2 TaxID=2692917 RepID=UPI001F0232F1|nr:DNA primase [Lactobacillus sp. S2-2]MCF6514990.1 DNA primase [Lactobacillus sp. S2-2]
MAKIPENVIEEVRSQTNITDIIDQYVQLSKSGNNLFGLCPFHDEKTPSFSVNEDKQIFHCFSCGRGGNVFKFLMDLKGLSFPESVMEVADNQNISLPDDYHSNSKPNINSDDKKLMQYHKDAVELYHHILVNTDLGKSALKYLHERKLTDEMINKFQIGFAPSTRLLKPFFENKQPDFQLLRKSGLFLENRDGDLVDRFVDRIMFPIRDSNGNYIAFSGRLIDKNDDAPKYLNSPETKIFNKSNVLFNLDLARPEIRNSGNVILFEGFMDVISAFQAGVTNGIASMGTSLTNNQISMIERITKEIYICYDGDSPGQNATNRALDIFKQDSNLKIGVISIPDGKDPDEFRRDNGNDQFKGLVKNNKESFVSFKLNFFAKQFNLKTDEGQLDYIQVALKEIADVPDALERDFYLNKLSQDFNFDKSMMIDKVNQMLQNHPKQYSNYKKPERSIEIRKNKQEISQVERAERLLIHRFIYSENARIRINNQTDFYFTDDRYQRLFIFLQEYFKNNDKLNMSELIDFIQDDNLINLLVDIDNTELVEDSFNAEEIEDCINLLTKKAPIENDLDKLNQELKESINTGDQMKQQELVIKIIELRKQMQ